MAARHWVNEGLKKSTGKKLQWRVRKIPAPIKIRSWGTFQIFLFFFCSGRGRGESEAPGGGGVDFSLKIPGGGSPGGRGAEGPGGCLRRIGDFGEGGATYFFFGVEVSCRERESPAIPGAQKNWCSHFRPRIAGGLIYGHKDFSERGRGQSSLRPRRPAAEKNNPENPKIGETLAETSPKTRK